MKEGKASETKFGNKGLVILLCVLVVAIVGLGVGIGIVMLNSREKTAVIEEDSTEEQVLQDKYVAYVDEYNAARVKAKELLGQDPVDTKAIVELYSNLAEQSFANDEIDRGSSYVYAEYDDLLNGGFKQEALDVMTALNLDIFNEPEQHMWCIRIISLAEELGNNEVVLQYQPLLAATEAAYKANVAAANAAAEEGRRIRENAINEGRNE